MDWEAHILGTRIGCPDGPEFTKAHHTDRTCRHVDKYFAFLLRQYLNLSNLIAVTGRMLTIPEAKRTAWPPWGCRCAPPGSPGCPCIALSSASCSGPESSGLCPQWLEGLQLGEAKGSVSGSPGPWGNLLRVLRLRAKNPGSFLRQERQASFRLSRVEASFVLQR